MSDLSVIIAFVAGLVSFVAPCILPVIPGFLAYLGGTNTGDADRSRGVVFLHSFLFVLGFSLVFAALGVLLNTLLERIAYDVQIWLSRIGGVLIIFFGLYLVGLIHLPWFEQKHGFTVRRGHGASRYATSLLFGAAFAAGWTPCVGAALGAILGLAASEPGTAFYLLMAYALGLGLPFLIVGYFAHEAQNMLYRFGRTATIINRAFGVLLIVIGVLVFTQQLSRIGNFELLNNMLLAM